LEAPFEISAIVTSWFEARGVAALLTMRVRELHPEEHRKAMRLEG